WGRSRFQREVRGHPRGAREGRSRGRRTRRAFSAKQAADRAGAGPESRGLAPDRARYVQPNVGPPRVRADEIWGTGSRRDNVKIPRLERRVVANGARHALRGELNRGAVASGARY